MQRTERRFPSRNWREIGLEEVVCAIVLAFFAVQGAIPGIAPNQATEMTNTAATGLMKVVGIGSQALVNAAICMLALASVQRLKRFLFALQWTAGLALFAVLSTLWSQDALTTARRSVPFALATVFGLYLASRFRLREQLAIFAGTMVVLAAASAVLALAVPRIGLEASTGHFGNWQGVFTQKNACGRAMVFALTAFLSMRGLRFFRVAGLVVCSSVLVMSGSRGAWLIATVVLACYGLLRMMERFRPGSRALLLAGSLLLIPVLGIVGWMYFPVIAPMLGRDATLSGRTAIWQQVWIAIVKHPMLGYGYGAFWEGMKGESYHVILALRFVIFHAHNGLLEIWLELGGAGLLLFALSYLRAWRRLWPMLRSWRLRETTWAVLVLMLILVYDLDENTLITFNGLYWVLYVAAVANVEIMHAEYRLTQRRRMFAGESPMLPAEPSPA